MKFKFPLIPLYWGDKLTTNSSTSMTNSSNVRYNGGTLSCSGIVKYDTLNEALGKLDAKICEPSGGVSSVGLSSTDLDVSGSPITSSGTININIKNSAVSYAKIQQVPAKRILGRYTNSTGIVQEISIGAGLDLSDAGVLTGTAVGTGTVTQIVVTSPLTGGTITTTGTIGLPQATAVANGYLSSGDWSAFDAKLDNITGLISNGTNVTITGTGTAGDPYVINASGGGGGGATFDTLSTFICQPNTTVALSSNNYINFNGDAFSGTQDDKIFVFPASGYLKDLFVLVSGTQPSSGSLVFTLMKGATVAGVANTALVLTVAANTAAGGGTVYSNTLNSVAVNAGDIGVLKVVNNATATSARIISASLRFTNS